MKKNSVENNSVKNIVNHIKKINEEPFEYIDKLSADEIETIILYAADKYYNTKKSVISDDIYDLLIDFLTLKNKKSCVLKNIGAKVRNTKAKVLLDYYLGSLDKIKPSTGALERWTKKYEGPYFLSDKLDGISALYSCKDSKCKLNTRGTATEGLDITKLIKYLKLPELKKNIAVRGELIMKKKTFEDNWSNTKCNTRNTISGLVNSKNFDPKLANDTEFVAYEVVNPPMEYEKAVKMLKELGFIVVKNKKENSLTDEKLSEYFKQRREKGKYDVDGIVVTNFAKHKKNTSGNPKYAFAFKDVLEDQTKETTVIKVEWKVNRNKITPTLVVEPIKVGGVEIKRVTGHNARFIVDNKIGKGSIIEIVRSGDVIPKVTKVIKSTKADLPDFSYVWNKNKVEILPDENKKDLVELRRIQFFFSKINAKGLGGKTIEKFYNAGYNTIIKILKLTKENIMEIEGFKEKSAENILKSMKTSLQDIKLENLVAASTTLGEGFGERRVKMILDKYPNLFEESYNKTELTRMIMEIDGFEKITTEKFVENYKEFYKFYNKIKPFIKLKNNKTKKKTSQKYKDMKIVLSGFRDKKLQEEIEEMGGKIVNTISKTTDILIVKDKSIISSKITKAKELGIKIMEKAELI